MKTLVSIVSFNSANTIVPCLESVLAQTGSEDFIIRVTDNASNDETCALLKENFGPRIELVESEVNLGFCRAHNLALQDFFSANDGYALILNPDLRLEPNAIEVLNKALANDTRAGFACPKLYRADSELEPVDPLRFDSTGMFITRNCRHLDRGSQEQDVGQFDKPEYLFGASGAAMFIKADFYKDVSFDGEFFDESFFAYREDAELSWRANWLGWKCRYEPRSLGYHQRHVLPEDRAKLPAELNRLSVQNRFLLQIRNFSFLANLPCLFPTTIRNIVVVFATLLVEQSSLPAFSAVIKDLPKGFSRRRRLFSRRRVSPAEMANHFSNVPASTPALSAIAAKKPLKHILAVIVNYNSGPRLKLCIEALRRGEGQRRLQILVIDNDSSDDDLESLQEELKEVPDLSFELQAVNLGFAGAINQAAKGQESDAILILNPDVEIDRENMRVLFQEMDKFENLGAISPLLYDKSAVLQRTFIARSLRSMAATLAELFFLHRIWPRNPLTAHLYQTDNFFLSEYLDGKAAEGAPYMDPEQPMVVGQPPAACLLVRREAFAQVGGFDEEFWPAWFEDLDFCKRLQDAGWCAAITRKARAEHEGGYSLSEIGQSEFAAAWYPNLLRYYKKHSSISGYYFLNLLLRLALVIRGGIAYTTGKRELALKLFSLTRNPSE